MLWIEWLRSSRSLFIDIVATGEKNSETHLLTFSAKRHGETRNETRAEIGLGKAAFVFKKQVLYGKKKDGKSWHLEKVFDFPEMKKNQSEAECHKGTKNDFIGGLFELKCDRYKNILLL